MISSQILVVEDERVVAFHLRQQLVKLGYEVPAPVSTGEHALRMIEESRPDLILMDIKIEGAMDGIATAARIPTEYRIPVIYLTAYSEEANLKRAGATCPYGYLLKPFSERELHAMIQMTLERCRSERASHTALEVRHEARKMEALGQLAGSVAQDFDGLVRVVYRNLEEMGDYTVTHPKLAEIVQQIFVAVSEREKLATQLLAFSRRQALTPRTVSIVDLVSDMVEELQRTLGDGIQTTLSFPGELWKARIDSNRFESALINLAVNARDAMPNGGNVTIAGQNAILDQSLSDGDARVEAGRYVALSFADTGTGMARHVIERALEPFFTTKPSSGRAGLGLSLVFGFVRQSGGHVSIDSEVGIGSTIRIYLPAVLDGAAAAEPPATERLRPAANVNLAAAGDTGSGDDKTTSEAAGPTTVEPAFPIDDALRWVAASRKNIISQTHEAMWRQHNIANSGSGSTWTNRGDRAFRVPWQKAENALFAAVVSGLSGVQYRLIVEELPRRNGWDWAVWRPGSTRGTSRHGRASAVLIAMSAAEDAARQWDETERPAG